MPTVGIDAQTRQYRISPAECDDRDHIFRVRYFPTATVRAYLAQYCGARPVLCDLTSSYRTRLT